MRQPARYVCTAALCATQLATLSHANDIRVGPFLQDADPTSVWVVWESTEPGDTTVEWGPGTLANTVTGSSRPSQDDNRIHQARITGLTPDTAYVYRVRTGDASSATIRFRTPPLAAAEKPFRFVAYSDVQGGPIANKHTEIINEGVIDFVLDNFGPLIADELAFSIVPGDLVSTGSDYNQWKTQFFDEEANLIRHIPVYPVAGNHEQDSHWYFDYFKLPENGTPGYLEHWYYKDFGNIRLIGLDSNGAYRIQAQLDWLDDVLADAATRDEIDFVFAQLHHPHLSGIWTPGNTDYTGDIVARLEAFSTATGKPSIHFFGHTHAYERGQSRDHNHLWVNVAAGEGGLDYWGITPPEDYDEFQRVFPEWGFVVMEVTAGDDPSFRLRRVTRGNEVEPKDNEIQDDITIRRYNNAPATPVPRSPGPDTTVDPDVFTLRAGPFADPDSDTHLASHFQITTVPGNYDAPVVDRWIRFENWYAPEGASGRTNGYYSVDTQAGADITTLDVELIDPNTTYAWRVRYRDSALAWSEWSQEMTFTTGDAAIGAYCLPDGTCAEGRLVEAIAAGGDWHGEGSTCADNPCPPVIVAWSEDFESVPLGPSVDEPTAQNVWSATPPADWSIDRSAMPTGGVTEWRGWSVANKVFWSTVAGDQGRTRFARATGAVAVADPDEWDDAPHAAGTFDSTITTPTIPIDALEPGTARLIFDSAWMPEGAQRATLAASYDGGAPQTLFVWESDTSSDNFHASNTNELVVVDLHAPAGASTVQFRFTLDNADNNWYWAIDNLRLIGAPRESLGSQLFHEDFDTLPLGQTIHETPPAAAVWTDTPPTGWETDDTGVPSIALPDQGVEEWEGWAFADANWWADTAGDQQRSAFIAASGTIAVADPDEWDDRGNPEALGPYNAALTTPAIPIASVVPGTLVVAFDSSWRPEDDQRASLSASFDGGPAVELLRWTSTAGADYKPDATNEHVELQIQHPASARTVRLTFGMHDAANDWWWAFDNLSVSGRCAAEFALPAGTLNNADINAFVSAFLSGDPDADVNADGALNNADINRFVSAFLDACG